MKPSAGPLAAKGHYKILDGLRGVAAILVVMFHILETYSGDRFHQKINHGYLAVDFFFLLSGFVVAYAYDDRWGKMTIGGFFKRRLIRLQPMLVVGMVIGAVLFYLQAGVVFPHIAATPVWKMLLVMVVGFTVLPLPLSMDIRGWQEMHPLDGPAWSLFYEYIANVLYALIFRRFSKFWLSVCVFFFACLLIHYLVADPEGDLIGGWALDEQGIITGFTRLLYPFFAGVLLMRVHKLIRVKNAFALCSVLLFAAFAVPRLGGPAHVWVNGLYEAVVVILLFPLIVSMGAGSEAKSKFTHKACNLLGSISYPLYITHYPLVYLFTAFVASHKIPTHPGLVLGAGVLVLAIAIAYALLKLYDEPVRQWLQKRYLPKKMSA